MRFLALTFALALAACSPAPVPAPNETAPAPTPVESAIPPAPTPSPAPIALGAVSEAAAAQLKGELRCAFLSDASHLLLVGSGDVDAASRATAVVMRSDKPVILTSTDPGGFDAMRKGGSFAGDDLAVAITRGAARETGHEGSSHTATLSVEAPGSAPLAIDGVWECGP